MAGDAGYPGADTQEIGTHRDREVPMMVRASAIHVSASLVALGVLAYGAFPATAWAQEAGVVAGLTGAPPGACGAAIARLETAWNQARASGQALATVPESVGAMLHHQPTRDSVAIAQSESERKVESSIALARKLRAEGKRAECIATVQKVSAVGTR
jgi:hypothetical protein